MEYITLRLDGTDEVEQWYVRHKYFVVLYYTPHVSTYIEVIFRPSLTGKSIKCYTCWDPIMLYMFRPIYMSSSGLLLQVSL